jgi:hypothetical protein
MRLGILLAGAGLLWAAPAAASFPECVAGLKRAAVSAGIGQALAERALSISAPDERVLRLSRAQPEFRIPIWDYFAFLVDDERIQDGRAMLRRYDRIFRAAEHDSLGLGGPVGGDLYYELASGYRWTSSARGPAVEPAAEPDGHHGFPSVSPDMYTVLCAEGSAFPPRRIGAVRTIDVAPTVAEWLGIGPIPTARGRSLLRELGGPYP